MLVRKVKTTLIKKVKMTLVDKMKTMIAGKVVKTKMTLVEKVKMTIVGKVKTIMVEKVLKTMLARIVKTTMVGKVRMNADKNGETQNGKSKVKNADEISNLGEIIAGKLAFGYIANPLVNIPTPGTIAPYYLAVPAFDSPALPWLGFSIIPPVSFDAFPHDSFLAFLVNSGTVKLLAEVIANFFGDNSSVITHFFHDSCTSEQAPVMFFEFEEVNFSLDVNVIFNTWS